ncbi:MAG: prolyl oligopeptidase family serine peptidase, partial [Bacteroidota bacterium]
IQLTNTIGSESSPRFTLDDTGILYISDRNVFHRDLNGRLITQLTNIQSGKARISRPSPKHKDWLEEDQLELFERLRWRKGQLEARSTRREAERPLRPSTIYVGDAGVFGQTVSPDLRYISFIKSEAPRGTNTKVPNFVTESGYIEDIRARSKVGSPQRSYELVIYDVLKDSSYTLETDELKDIKKKPAFLADYHEGDEEYEQDYKRARDVFVTSPVYADDGKAALVIRSMDNKDRWIYQLNPENGSLTLIDHQRDEAWIAGPGIGWSRSTGNMGWLPDNETLWFQSEETGYSNLYLYNVNTKQKKALAPGNYEILDAKLSNDGSTFYVTANAEGPHEQHFYHLPIAEGKLKRITQLEGAHQVTMSPDEQQLAIRYSASNQPWELHLMENKAGVQPKPITKSTTEAFDGYNWRIPEIVYFTASDGVKVPARIYRPKKAKKNGPAVIFVHGAGYLQNVHKWWSSYYREYMFHNMLTDNGYTVLDIDYRGSAGYGRDWRTAIYRHMGGKDLSDQVDGAKFLVEEYNVDPDRIGIYGGSYGGFITLMGLFTSPGTFKSGAALRSVTDWAHYNHGYTSNILNTPVEDPIAFRRSSPIYFAEGLQDNLLILHGMIDDNVQFQDVVRLSQRLIELGKDNWEFAVFPIERHGFVEPSSWTDEYKRIFKLFQTTLK